MTDFIITDHGTTVLFTPISEAAKEFTTSDELGLADWQFIGNDSFAIDHRPAAELVNQLFLEGWQIS